MLVEPLLNASSRTPNKLAVTDPNRELTYKQLTAFAAALRAMVLKQTDCPRVGVMMPSLGSGMALFYGIWWAGRTVVPLNFLAPAPELAAIIDDAGIDLIITIEPFADALASLPIRKIYLEQMGLKRKTLAALVRRWPALPENAPDETAVILYTSGTTGRPKGVCLSFDNLRSNAEAGIEHMRLAPDHQFLGVIPSFHVYGLSTTILCPVLVGATTHFLPRFQPLTVINTIHERRITVVVLVASMYQALARTKLPGDRLASVELAISGGEPLPPAAARAFAEKFGVPLLEGYGMTETSPFVSVNRPTANKPGTAGQLLSGVEVRIVDDNGQDVSAGAGGEILVRGPGVMRGYYNQPEETAKAVDETGWLWTGDIGTLDNDGYLSITGRKKEMIIVGGENVYPREVEDILTLHDDVAEAAVIGVPDASRGEVVAAVIVPAEDRKPDEIAIRDFCRKRLAGFKVPRQVRVGSDLPRGPTGKILKRKLHELFR